MTICTKYSVYPKYFDAYILRSVYQRDGWLMAWVDGDCYRDTTIKKVTTAPKETTVDTKESRA